MSFGLLLSKKKSVKSSLPYHNKPRDLGRISDRFQRAAVDVCLHFKIEEKALIDDVRQPTVGRKTSPHYRIYLKMQGVKLCAVAVS